MEGRYAIISDYFGLFDEKRTIAVTDSITDAKFIVEALEKALEDRPFLFSCEKLVKDFNPILDCKATFFDFIEIDEGGDKK